MDLIEALHTNLARDLQNKLYQYVIDLIEALPTNLARDL